MPQYKIIIKYHAYYGIKYNKKKTKENLSTRGISIFDIWCLQENRRIIHTGIHLETFKVTKFITRALLINIHHIYFKINKMNDN